MHYKIDSWNIVRGIIPAFINGVKYRNLIKHLFSPIDKSSEEFNAVAEELNLTASLSSQIIILEDYLDKVCGKIKSGTTVSILDAVATGYLITHDNHSGILNEVSNSFIIHDSPTSGSSLKSVRAISSEETDTYNVSVSFPDGTTDLEKQKIKSAIMSVCDTYTILGKKYIIT